VGFPYKGIYGTSWHPCSLMDEKGRKAGPTTLTQSRFPSLSVEARASGWIGGKEVPVGLGMKSTG